MKKIFIIYGILLCSVFGYVTYRGLDVIDALKSGAWDKKGATHKTHGGFYHK